MKIILTFLILGVFTLALLQGADIDKKAPDFTLHDFEGDKHTLSQYKGKYVVLEWVNFGCPFVKKHYDSGNMQYLQSKYKLKDVVWLTICSSAEGKAGYYSNEELGKVLKMKKFAGTGYLVDTDGKVGKMYNAKTTPHVFVIDPKGVLIYTGAVDDIRSTKIEDIKKATNYIAASLENSIAGKPVEVKTTTSYGCGIKYK